MSSKATRSTSRPAPTVDIPDPLAQPDVLAAQARYDAIAAELAAVRRDITAAESSLAVRPGTPDHEVEGRLIAAGRPTEPVSRLRALREREKALDYARGLVEGDVTRAAEAAKRELTARTRDRVFLPAAREAVAAWLACCRAVEQFRQLVDRIQAEGVGAGTFSPFNGRVPVCLADHDGFQAFARELIGDGFTDADTVNAALPAGL